MRVFAENNGAVFIFASCKSFGIFNWRIHGTNNICELTSAGSLCNETTTFVAHRPGHVELSNKLPSFTQIAATPSFVSKGPEHDRSMVPVPLHCPQNPRHESAFPAPVLGQPTHWFHTMGLDIGFIPHIQTIVVAQSVKGRVRGIVACPDSVEVILPSEQLCKQSF